MYNFSGNSVTPLSNTRFHRATACDATHGIAVGIMSVRLSLCLSVRQMRVL